MVSQEQLRSFSSVQRQIKGARASLEQEKKRTEAVRASVSKAPTQTELRTATRKDILARSQQKRKAEAELKKRSQFLAKQEAQIFSAEKQVAAQKQSQEDLRLAKEAADRASRGKPFADFGLTGEQKKIFRDIISGQRAFKQRGKAVKELGAGDFAAGIEKLKQQKKIIKEFGDLSKVDLEKLSPGQLNRFEAAGLVTLSSAKPQRQVSEFEKLIPAPQSRAFDFKRFVEEGGSKGTLPPVKTRLEKADEIAQRFTTPEGVLSLFAGAAELDLRAGEKLGEKTEELLIKAGVSEDNILFREGPLTRGQTRDIIRDFFVFSAFNPFIKTATAKKGSAEAKATQETVSKTDKQKIKKLMELRKKLNEASKKDVITIVKKQINDINKAPLTQGEKANRLRNLEIFVREARGQIKVVDNKIIPIIDLDKLAARSATKSAVEVIKKGGLEITLPTTAKLEKLPELLTAVSVISKLGKKGEVDKIKQELKDPKLSPLQIFSLNTRLDVLSKQSAATAALSLSSLNSQLQASKSLQNSLQKQLQLSKTSQLKDSMQATRQASLLRQISAQQARAKQISRQIKSIKPTQKGKGIPKIPFDFDSELLKKNAGKLKPTGKAGGYQPLIKTGGKFKKFSKPFKSKAQAENFAKWLVDNSTSARFKIQEVPGVKDFSKKFAPPTSNLKFRRSRFVNKKKIPLRNFGGIEKRKHRIDSLGEKRQLKAAKVVAQRFGKKKKPIQRKGTKKIGGSVSLRAAPKIKLKK